MTGHGTFQYMRLRTAAAIMRTLAAGFQGHLRAIPADSNSESLQIPSRDAGRTIEARLYRPGEKGSPEPDAPLPVLINWHGGGFTMPNLGLDHEFLTRVAQENSMLVLDADYRKGPEYPFPAAIHDAEDVMRYVDGRPEQFDVTRVALSGGSSGGVVALVAASSLRARFDTLHVRSVVLFYPGTDLAEPPEDKVVPHPIKAMPPKLLHMFYDNYVPDAAMRKDPLVSPRFAHPALFPASVVIFTASGDVLAPEGNELARVLDDGTRRVTHMELEDAPHGYDKGPAEGSHLWGLKERSYGIAVKELARALSIQQE
ncbi:unnamed protein product [Clonostachys solani]|uniref:Alpha/beta hydrolase fold-3 domain-containing protein n=1 Tax=Clonostachys solani TaxID=160281 RepID=A0A9P0EP33_9HYPO|nr:unnamed protein product [Clonostachys solani]